jgi:hypothetical protein
LNVVPSDSMNCSNMLVRGCLTLCLHRGTRDLGCHMEVRSHARSSYNTPLSTFSRAGDAELTYRKGPSAPDNHLATTDA